MPPDDAEPYSPAAKRDFCRRLAGSALELADFLSISQYDRMGFDAVGAPRAMWDWLSVRHRLLELPIGLREIGRSDLADLLDQDRPGRGASSRPGELPAWLRGLDTAYFDLEPLKYQVMEAQAAASPGLLCFAVPHHAPVIGDRLCAWLPFCFRPIAIKQILTLRPHLISGDGGADQVLRYQKELKTSNVACHVHVQDASVETVTAFHETLRTRLAGIDHWLVLVLTGAPAEGLPETVWMLPAPRIVTANIRQWVGERVQEREWPVELAHPWVDRIRGYAGDEGGELDIRALYEILRQDADELQHDAAGFRSELEGRGGRAQSS